MDINKKKILWTLLYLTNWGIILWFWFSGSGRYMLTDLGTFLVALGRISGLAAAYMILLQLFLMGRSPWLESVFGLDNLSRYHQLNGKTAFYFLLAHPVLLTFGYSRISGQGLWPQLLDFLFNFKHVNLALLALILFFIVIGTSIYMVRSKLRYETWYFVHLATYIAVFASLFHQITLGEDLIGSNLFYGYWVFLYTVVFTNHLIFRFARPVYLFQKHAFHISRIIRETPNAVSLYISGDNLSSFKVQPGQFMIFRFFSKKLWWQAHPFSLSMPPDGKEIRITVKELGDFTQQIKDLSSGTKVMIDGPYGVFTDLFSLSSRVLLIAGGIGITPLRSLAEEMLKKGKDIVILYGNKNKQETVFMDELSELEQKYRAKITYVMSDDSGYAGEKGRIDGSKIQKLVPDWHEREVYVCGPEMMNRSIMAFLKSAGMDPLKIHHEKFAF